MNQKTVLRIAFAAGMLVVATAATAHGNHDTPKLKPETCEQLADRARYSNDLSDPDIKALKDKCDAETTTDSSADKDAPKKDDQQG